MNINYFKSKKVAITGGTGFIGSHLLTKILKQDPSKVLLISRGSKTDRIRKHLSQVDLKLYNSSKEYVRHIINFDADYLFILGGNSDPRLSIIDPKVDLEHNFLYNFNLFQELIRNKNPRIKMIYISSVAVYGESKSPLNEETSVTKPKSPYGINKLAAEGYIKFFSQSAGLKGISVRLFSTYGPNLEKQVVYDLIKKLLDNPKNLTLRGEGSEIRDLSFVDDQIDGLMLLTQKATFEGEVYNLGSGVGISVRDLALKIAKLMGANPKIIFDKKNGDKYYGHTWIADISKILKLNFKPKTKLDGGLRKTIEWVMKK